MLLCIVWIHHCFLHPLWYVLSDSAVSWDVYSTHAMRQCVRKLAGPYGMSTHAQGIHVHVQTRCGSLPIVWDMVETWKMSAQKPVFPSWWRCQKQSGVPHVLGNLQYQKFVSIVWNCWTFFLKGLVIQAVTEPKAELYLTGGSSTLPLPPSLPYLNILFYFIWREAGT